MVFGAGAEYFSFGVENPYLTLPAEGSRSDASAKMSLSEEVFPSWPAEAGDEQASAGSGILAFATTKQVPTLKESDSSRPVEEVSNNMSEQEESASNRLEQVERERDGLQTQLDALKAQLTDEYNRTGNLEIQNGELIEQLNQCKAELSNSRRINGDTEYSLKQTESKLVEEQTAIRNLETRNARLEKDLALREAAVKDKSNQNDNLHADNVQLQQAYEAIARERDDVLVQCKDKELQFEDLHDQWQKAEERIAELEDVLTEHVKFEENNDLQGDIAELKAEHERTLRTIDVKDERISHLEALLQKEKERNLHHADETARAAAASPVDDDRHIGSMGDTLEHELSMLDESEWVEPEPSDYEPAYAPPSTTHIFVAASTEPVAVQVPTNAIAVREAASVEPRQADPAPTSTVHVHQAASTEPVAVIVPVHAIAVREAASVKPQNPAPAPPSTVNVKHAASTEPKAASVPIQTIEFREAASTPPAEPSRITLSFYNVRDVFSCAPEQPAGALLDIHQQDAASTEPMEPARVSLLFNNVHNIASYAPREPTGARLAIHEQHAASTEPAEPAPAPLSLYNVHEIASYAPKESAGARLAWYEQEVAHLSPRSPVPVVSTIVGHEIVNFAPREPSPPLLTLNVTEGASTIPVVRQTTTTDFSTQTDAPATTTAELSTQTDAPATTIDFSTQTDAPALTSQLLLQAALETIPVQPDPQPAIVKPTNCIAPVMVTREIKPIEQAPPKPEPKRPTTNSSKKTGIMDWIPMLLNVLLVVYSLFLSAELAAWKNANGVGFGGGYGNVASRSGAYGNGRHLFGVIPVGMHIGNSWVSEQIARHMSVAISLIEDFAGITNEPHY
jgi:hypothetical protein